MVGRVAVCDPPGLCRTVSVSAVSFCVSDTVIEETAGGSQVRLRQRLGYRSGFQTAMAVLTYPLQILVFRWELRVVTRRLKRAAEAHYQATLEGAR